MTQIYFFCPDDERPCGGVRKMYKQVDILNEAGFQAFILHQKEGFRCTWFTNQTPIAYFVDGHLRTKRSIDYLVLPEIFGPDMGQIAPGVKKVVFNQNCYLSFRAYSYDRNDFMTPYLNSEVVAALVVSEDNKNYLSYVFPKLSVERIHYGIDENLFYCSKEKKAQIAFMPRKNSAELTQVINILKFRGVLREFELVSIHNKNEEEVAQILRESLMFLSFGYPEGFSLPPTEAMACGCIVIGYHGMGGKEFFKEEFSYPIPQGDVVAFAKTVERVIYLYKTNPSLLKQQAEAASAYVKKHYSLKQEKEDIIHFWEKLSKHS